MQFMGVIFWALILCLAQFMREIRKKRCARLKFDGSASDSRVGVLEEKVYT